MRAKERKLVTELLGSLPNSKPVKKLREGFQDKGFLSKREMKILQNLATKSEAA